MTHPLYQELLDARIVAILRGLKKEIAVECGVILANAGIRFMEVPLNTPDAFSVIRCLAEHFRHSPVRIGAGTVLKPDQVRQVRDAGGTYIISPNVSGAVIRMTKELGMLSMPGFQTPTEAFAAIDAGADVLKAFPCGTPRDITILKSVIPLPVFAVGGIDIRNKDEFLKVAAGIGVGAGLFTGSMTPAELELSAERFMNTKGAK